MPFISLPLKKIENNTVNLVAAINAFHEKHKYELTNTDKFQIILLDGLFNSLNRLNKEANEDLITYYQKELDIKLSELNKIDAEIKSNPEEAKSKELYELKNKVQSEYKRIMRLYLQIVNIKYESKEIKQAREMRVLTDEQKKLIATGAYLSIKNKLEKEKALEQENESYLSRWLNKPKPKQRDVLLASIPSAIGITEDNPMDPAFEKIALGAFYQFQNNMGLNFNLSEEVKDNEIAGIVNAKFKLKHVNTDERYWYPKDSEVSTSNLLLLPSVKRLKVTPDMSDKVKGEIEKQIKEYTPLSEIGKYYRDTTSLSNHEALNEYITACDNWGHFEKEVKDTRHPSEMKDVRDANSEEYMPYAMSDKHYKEVKIKNKNPVKVLDSWKGEYKKEDIEKVKASWKGVQEPKAADWVQEKSKKVDHMDARFTIFNESKIKSDIEKFNKDLRYPKQLKAVPEDQKHYSVTLKK